MYIQIMVNTKRNITSHSDTYYTIIHKQVVGDPRIMYVHGGGGGGRVMIKVSMETSLILE